MIFGEMSGLRPLCRGRFLWVLSSKILPKIVAAHPFGGWVTAAAQLKAAKYRMST